jgi:hypothetical protein
MASNRQSRMRKDELSFEKSLTLPLSICTESFLICQSRPVVDSHGLVQAFKKSLPGPPKAHGPGGLRPNRVISTRESSGSQN